MIFLYILDNIIGMDFNYINEIDYCFSNILVYLNVIGNIFGNGC